MKSWALGLASLVGFALASTGFAETIGVTLRASPGTTGTYYSPGISSGITVSASIGSNTVTYNRAGAFRWSVTSDSSPATFGGYVNSNIALYTFCIQIFQSTGSTYNVNPLSSTDPFGGTDAGYVDLVAAQQMQGLVNAFWNKVDFNNAVGAVGASDNTFAGISGTYTDNEVAAAFALALWEIEYDGGSDTNNSDSYHPDVFRTGGSTNFFDNSPTQSGYHQGNQFTASATTTTAQKAINLANSWLNSTLWTPDTALSSKVLTSNSYQDQLFGIPNAGGGASQPTPLPASLPAGLGLMGGLIAYRKLRKKKA